MPNETTSRYANNLDHPQSVTCKPCSEGKTDRVLILRDEIGHHDWDRHGGIAPNNNRAEPMTGFSNLESTLHGLWSQDQPRDIGGLLAVAEAAQTLLDQLIPLTPGGLDELLGNMVIMRRMNDAENASKKLNPGRYEDWAESRELVKCLDCSRETGTFLVPRAATNLHNREVHAGPEMHAGETMGEWLDDHRPKVPPGM